MSSLAGRAIVRHPDGTVAWTGLATATEMEMQGLEYRHRADIAKARDRSGDIISKASYGDEEEITITVIPSAGTGAGENTMTNAKLAPQKPANLGLVTLSFSIALLDGDWNYECDGGLRFNNETGFAEMTFKCTRVGGAALAVVS